MDDILNRSVSHWLLVIKYIIPLCTLGSIYSTNAGGAGQMTETNNSNQTAGYLQSWSRIWTRDYREQIQLAVRAGLELKASELQVQRSNQSDTLPASPIVGSMWTTCSSSVPLPFILSWIYLFMLARKAWLLKPIMLLLNSICSSEI